MGLYEYLKEKYRRTPEEANRYANGIQEEDLETGAVQSLPDPRLQERPEPEAQDQPGLFDEIKQKMERMPDEAAEQGRANSRFGGYSPFYESIKRRMQYMPDDARQQVQDPMNDPWLRMNYTTPLGHAETDVAKYSLMPLLMKSAAQVGTLGGKQADTKSLDEPFKAFADSRMGIAKRMAARPQLDIDRRFKMAQMEKMAREREGWEVIGMSEDGLAIYRNNRTGEEKLGQYPMARGKGMGQGAGQKKDLTFGSDGGFYQDENGDWIQVGDGKPRVANRGQAVQDENGNWHVPSPYPDPVAAGQKPITPYQQERLNIQKKNQAEQEEQRFDTKMERLGTRLGPMQEIQNAIKQFENVVGSSLKIPNFTLDAASDDGRTVNGKEYDLPGVSIPGVGRVSAYSSDARQLQAVAARIFNVELKDRSGTAVTDNELNRLKSEFESGHFNTEHELISAVKRYRNAAARVMKNRELSFNKDVLKEYKNRGGQLSDDYSPQTQQVDPLAEQYSKMHNIPIDQADRILKQRRAKGTK